MGMITKSEKFTLLSSVPVQTLSSIIFGGIFIFASIDKIIHPNEFAKILYNYKLLPDFIINVMAIILPWTELLLGSFLFLGIYPWKSALVLSSLIVVFIIAILINVIRGLNINCGCFTTNPDISNSPGLQLIIRDIIILIPGILIIFFRKKS